LRREPIPLQTILLRNATTPEEYLTYLAGLEWDLIDPIVIEAQADFQSEPHVARSCKDI
jgi:hypothetical protein